MKLKYLNYKQFVSTMTVKWMKLKNCHPKQIASEVIPIPTWKIKYKHTIARGNPKEAVKYMFLDKDAWDSVDQEFMNYIKELNEKHPERIASNVEILDAVYFGKLYLEKEDYN